MEHFLPDLRGVDARALADESMQKCVANLRLTQPSMNVADEQHS